MHTTAPSQQMRHRADAGWWVRLPFAFSSMVWAGVLAVTVTTAVAHFAFRQDWRIAEYDRD